MASIRARALVFASLLALVAVGAARAGELSPEEMERLREILRKRGAPSVLPAPETHPDRHPAPKGPAVPESRQVKPPAPPRPDARQKEKPDEKEALSAFERYVRGESLAKVSTELKQFGYEMFRGRPERFAPVTNVAAGPDYVLGPGDEVILRIWGKVELDAAATVDRGGKLALPRVGVLPVAGKTLAEVRTNVRARYDKVFNDYKLDVSLGELRSIGVLVVGSVRRPGRHNLSSVATVLNALMVAGGPTKTGSLRGVVLKRNGKTAATLDVYALITAGKRAGDVRLQPEDTVFVPTAGNRVAVAGSVRRPAIYELKAEDMNLSAALNLAGGLEPNAARERVQVERVGADGKISLEEVDLGKLVAEKGFPLRDGDVVRVFSVLRKPVNVVYLAGNVARPGAYRLAKDMRVSGLIRDLGMLVPEEAWKAARPPAPSEAPAGTPKAGTGPETVFPEPYWDYALIRRVTRPRMQVEYIPFNLGRALLGKSPADDMKLQPADTVVVFSRWDFVARPMARVGGAVNRPGGYPLTPNMTLRDLVGLAGGLKRYAFRGQAELLRVHYEEDGQREERLLLDLGEALAGKAEHNFKLQERDHLFVRSVPEHRPAETVTLGGEVRFPGTYPLRKGERLSSLIERAGGYTERAYLNGAVFKRESVRRIQQDRIKQMLVRLETELSRSAAAAA
ncbi:MAG: SLBB domain-containing protein, partial [Planctomycetota bacterium]